MRAEAIVVDASSDETASLVRLYFPAVKLICLASGTLTPVLWSTGIASARGKRIATITGHFVVPASWAGDLSAALDSGAAGAGGPVSLRRDASLVDSAIYFLRYSAFLPSDSRTVAEVSEIPGDNAMYEGSRFEENRSLLGDGFWEVAMHRAMRAKGQRLVMVQSATAEFGKSFPLADIASSLRARPTIRCLARSPRWDVEGQNRRCRAICPVRSSCQECAARVAQRCRVCALPRDGSAHSLARGMLGAWRSAGRSSTSSRSNSSTRSRGSACA